jgi:hypothetical protein
MSAGNPFDDVLNILKETGDPGRGNKSGDELNLLSAVGHIADRMKQPGASGADQSLLGAAQGVFKSFANDLPGGFDSMQGVQHQLSSVDAGRNLLQDVSSIMQGKSPEDQRNLLVSAGEYTIGAGLKRLGLSHGAQLQLDAQQGALKSLNFSDFPTVLDLVHNVNKLTDGAK